MTLVLWTKPYDQPFLIVIFEGMCASHEVCANILGKYWNP